MRKPEIAGISRCTCRLACHLAVLVLSMLMFNAPSQAAENPLYTITGVEVDVTAESASLAKQQAITEANVMAFRRFVRRVGGASVLDQVDSLPPKQINAMLSSLSIEEERTGPRRYIGKLTVRFLPDKVRATMAQMGLRYSDKVAGKIVIIPVWHTQEGVVVWEENPWRDAWLSLGAENSLVPVIIPVGDFADTSTLTTEMVTSQNAEALEAIRLRYDADALLVADAAPQTAQSIQAVMAGKTPVGAVSFDNIYKAENQGGLAEAAKIAASRFHQTLVERWKKKVEATAVTQSVPVSVLPVAVAFYSTDEWNALRARILSIPGISGVDISTISQGGAIIQLSYVSAFEQLRQSLWTGGLALQNVGGTWVLQAN